jgi:hypothetical protein
MIMAKVLIAFADLQDDNYVYNPGDEYPREGVIVSKDRLAELSGSDNLLGKPLIEKVDKKKKK